MRLTTTFLEVYSYCQHLLRVPDGRGGSHHKSLANPVDSILKCPEAGLADSVHERSIVQRSTEAFHMNGFGDELWLVIDNVHE